MKQTFRAILVFLALIMLPTEVLAYSYGDPKEEAVAETFKAIATELEKPSIDWKKVEEVYKVRRSEIASHFGDSVAATLDRNIEAKDKTLLLDNYKAVLVMNLKRRFDYAKKDINEYSKSSLLLAKARGTYEVLDSYVEALKPGASAKIYVSFDAALEALGNPGLFSVGQRPTDAEQFKKQVDSIYSTVRPLFPYKAASSPVKPEAAQPEENKTAEKTAANEKTTAASSAGGAGGSTSTENGMKEATESSSSGSKTNSVSGGSDSSGQESEQTATEGETDTDPAVEADQEAAAETENAGKEAEVEDNPGETSGESGEQADTPVAESIDASAETVSAPAEAAHAPMERSNKTNAGVSIAVIGFVILLAGGTFWFARKKKLF